MYLHISLFLLMYADDTVDGVENMLDSLYTYTTKCNIDVNIDKTKMVVFTNGGKVS